tara:strand:- start:1493 stop:1852 length:360 start_codon:yes stop_codon:yes gene_type:complete
MEVIQMTKASQIKTAQESIKQPNNVFYFDYSSRQALVREQTKILGLMKEDAIKRFKSKNLLIFKPFKIWNKTYNGNAKKIERESARVDTKKLKEKYPEIYNECLKPSSSVIIETNFEIV